MSWEKLRSGNLEPIPLLGINLFYFGRGGVLLVHAESSEVN